MSARLLLTVCAALALGGCGSNDPSSSPEKPTSAPKAETEGGATMETTDAGTKIIMATDQETNLVLEVQNNSVYLKAPSSPDPKIAALRGKNLGGACDVSAAAGFSTAELFPLYWREDSGDWGSALARGLPVPDDEEPTLAEFVTECRLYAAPAGSDEIRLENLLTTITVR